MVSTLMNPLIGKVDFFSRNSQNHLLSGMDILRDDIYAIFNQIMNSDSVKTKRNTFELPGKGFTIRHKIVNDSLS